QQRGAVEFCAGARALHVGAANRGQRPSRHTITAPKMVSPSSRARCSWPTKPLDIAYHDSEWGVPLHDDRALFELLTLEGAQAGLSWSTILKKRDGYREAFANFDVARVARFTPARVQKLLANAGIVRNRLKIESTITNAQAFLRVVKSEGTF